MKKTIVLLVIALFLAFGHGAIAEELDGNSDDKLDWVKIPTVDEDNMFSDSNTLLPTQQSVKAYADTKESGVSNDFDIDRNACDSTDNNLLDEVCIDPGISRVGESTIPSGTDPDLTGPGQLSHDTDGGNVSGSESLRGYDSSGNQIVWADRIKRKHFSPIYPHQMPTWTGHTNPSVMLWPNHTGYTFTITRLLIKSDGDNFVFNIYETFSSNDLSDENWTLVDAITVSNDGVEGFYVTETVITGPVIETGHALFYEYVSGTANQLYITAEGWFNGDVD